MPSKKSPSISAKQPSYSAPALEKGIDILELLGSEPSGLSISEMATRMGRSISELFRVVVVLDRRGWLHKHDASDRYRATYKLLEVAHRATPAQELTHVAAPEMSALVRTVEQSCHLVVVNGGKGLIVLRLESPSDAGFAVRLGTPVDLASSCSGHVLLAFSGADKRKALLASAKTDRSLDKRLDQVRKAGFERISSARMAGVSDMSCPVFGFDGNVVAALTIPFLEAIDGAPHVDADEALIALKAAAFRISTALGWFDRGNDPIVPTLSVPASKAKRRSKQAGRQSGSRVDAV